MGLLEDKVNLVTRAARGGREVALSAARGARLVVEHALPALAGQFEDLGPATSVVSWEPV